MRRLPLLLPLLLLPGFLATVAHAQQRFWANSVSGVWDDPANWSAGDVPDTASESAIFDRFGTYNVSLPDTGPITVHDWTVDRGDVTFQSAGFGLATLDVRGTATFDGEVLLRGGLGALAIDVAGGLAVRPDGLATLDGVAVTGQFALVNQIDAVSPTRLVLDNESTLDVEFLEIAASGGSVRSSIDLFNGSTLTTGRVRLSNRNTDAVGELNLVDAHLVAGLVSIGQDDGTQATRGTLAIVGGTAEMDQLRVEASGLVRNSSGLDALSGGPHRERGLPRDGHRDP